MVMWPARQPGSDQRSFVGRVIVHDDVDVEVGRHLRVDLLEEVEELGRPVPLVAFADDEARGDIECRKQRGRAVADVAVGATLGHARHHRQNRLLPVERLDLTLLIYAQDQRPVGGDK